MIHLSPLSVITIPDSRISDEVWHHPEVPNPFPMHILCLGAGRLGSAIDHLLKDGGHYVATWDIDPDKHSEARPLHELATSADIVFVCMPTWCLDDAFASLMPHLKDGAVVVTFMKGMLKDGNKGVHEALAERLGPDRPFVLVCGPMMAEEMVKDLGGVGVAAGPDAGAVRRICDLFAGTGLHLFPSDDLPGVAFSGVAKNVYATVMGLADGLGWQGNMKGALGAACLEELPRLVEALGGRRETALGPAGVGDFLATAMSPYSKNRRIGEEWARTGTCCVVSEGTASVAAVSDRVGGSDDLPILRAIVGIVRDGDDPTPALLRCAGILSDMRTGRVAG